MKNVLDSTIKIIKYMKSGSLSICLFKELSEDIFSTHDFILHVCTLAVESKRSKPCF